MSGALIRLVLFLLPFLLFLTWLYLVRQIRRGDGEKVNPVLERLIVWGGGAFILLFALGLFLYGQSTVMPDSDKDAMRYVPATIENGQLVPGHYEKIPKR